MVVSTVHASGMVAMAVLALIFGATAHGQTDVSASVFGAFSGASNVQGTTNGSGYANTWGVLAEVRHIHSPWLGVEGTYSFNPADRASTLHPFPLHCANSTCPSAYYKELASVHTATGNWVVSREYGRLRPFGFLGGGFTLFAPSSSGQLPAQVSGTGVLVYGGGADWSFSDHFGLRAQFRGNLYKIGTTAYGYTYPANSGISNTAEPAIGVYYRR